MGMSLVPSTTKEQIWALAILFERLIAFHFLVKAFIQGLVGILLLLWPPLFSVLFVFHASPF